MKQRVLFIVAIFIAWLPVFMIQKPAFMAYHHELANSSSLIDYLQVIFHGLKLDCTMSGYLTAIPLLLTTGSVWLHGIWLRKLLSAYFLIMAALVAAIFSIDIALYGFWGFRLDATLFFYLQSPKDAMASVPVGLFIIQLLLFFAYTYIIYIYFRKCILSWTPETMVRKRIIGTISCLLLGGILFIPIRGGVTTSTANVGMVYFSQNQFLNHAAINPCFSLVASLSKQQDFAAQFNFLPEERREELFKQLTSPRSNKQFPDSICPEKQQVLTTTRPNILIILLESFSANAIGAVGGEKDVTPNIDRLSKEGILFTNLYANSFRTDRGIVSVLNGYLAQPTTSIMKYPAKSQTLPSIAKSLDKEGYTADMLYGGDINFTNMQSYFFSSGYSKITADRDFPLSSRLSKWGTNDDITFTWLYNNIKERDNTKPWLTTFLTLSSHEPFEVPFHHLEHPYLNSVAFTDSCLGSFIDKMKLLPAWKNTLIILVADHGFRYPEDVKDFEPRRFHIPMIWLGGAIKEPMVVDKYANQTDLAATLLNQLGLKHNEFAFSKDIFDPCYPEYAFYTFTNGFGFINRTGYSIYDNESNKILMESSSDNSSERTDNGKALLQTLYDDLGSR
ncbi:LTA synthase family protein [Parabacteroides provencensis]|uniref:LTA synthase family protein n=1 Tax=Parabacteroides provencensis TaxID=1944636 RepID=UPI000C158A1F|nr:LTA synthase family protein [Parabacteroides provencensis]